jgi:uncharacterized protein YuzE
MKAIIFLLALMSFSAYADRTLDQMVTAYTRAYNKKHKTQHRKSYFLSKLAKLGLKMKRGSDAKLSFEEYFKGKDLAYNVDSTNPFEAFEKNELQCHSGTVLYLMARKLLDYAKRDKDIVIHMDGHVLPGHLDENGNVIGIEMTNAGEARVNFGPLKKIHNGSQKVRIVEREDFLKLQLLQLTYQSYAVAQFGQKVAKKGLKKGYLSKNDFKEMSKSQTGKKSDALNTSFFSFGEVNVPKGKIKRKYLKERDCVECQEVLAPRVYLPNSLPDFAQRLNLATQAKGYGPEFRQFFSNNQCSSYLSPVTFSFQGDTKIRKMSPHSANKVYPAGNLSLHPSYLPPFGKPHFAKSAHNDVILIQNRRGGERETYSVTIWLCRDRSPKVMSPERTVDSMQVRYLTLSKGRVNFAYGAFYVSLSGSSTFPPSSPFLITFSKD